MPKSSKQQGGMTYIGMILVIIFIVFVAVVVMKLLPLYLENMKVQSVLDGVASDTATEQVSEAEIMDTILKRLGINDVEHVEKRDIDLKRVGSALVISVEYEVRTPLMYNLDVVAKFDNQATLGQH